MSDKEIMALKAARVALYKQAETGSRYCTKTGSMAFDEAAEIVEKILLRELNNEKSPSSAATE